MDHSQDWPLSPGAESEATWGPTPAAGAGQRPPTRPPPWLSVEGGPSPSPRSGRGLRGSLGPGVPASAPTALTCSHTSTPSSAPSAGRHPPAERGGRGGTTKGLGSSSAPPSHVALGSVGGPVTWSQMAGFSAPPQVRLGRTRHPSPWQAGTLGETCSLASFGVGMPCCGRLWDPGAASARKLASRLHLPGGESCQHPGHVPRLSWQMRTQP